MTIHRLFEIVAVSGLIAASCALGYWLFEQDSAEARRPIEISSIGFPDVGRLSGDIAYSSVREVNVASQGLPVRLKIPVIMVDSLIEDAFLTPEGRMDVPSGIQNVAWYAPGTQPGQVGSAVIGGHYAFFEDNRGLSVFYNLDKLNAGDRVYVEDDRGDITAFVVRSIRIFDRNADATSVFASSDGLAHLNLVTCEGIWNSENDTYPDRRVVFTDAVKDFKGVISGPKSTVTFHRTLVMGSRGEDVATLQGFLEEKGFLSMPPGVPKGYFGQLTRVAMAKYQVSVGLPSVGVFGPLTRIKLISELGS